MNQIFDIIKNLVCGKYIQKSQRSEIDELCKKLNDVKYEKLKEELIKVVSSTKYTKTLEESIKKLIDSLKDDVLTTEQMCDLIVDAIKEIQDENLEEILDSECDRYMKFTKNNPAEYIMYNNNKKYFVLSLPNKKEKSSKNLLKIVQQRKEKLSQEIGKIFSKMTGIKKIEYKRKKIIIYWHNNKPYYDLNHVINLLDNLGTKYKKYQENSCSIVMYDTRDNQHGGFYIKEFIDQEKFFDILLSSNSLFSIKFKNDISKILDQLANSGQLVLSNDCLTFNTKLIKKPIDHFYEKPIYDQTYDNHDLVDSIKCEIKKCKQTNWMKYLNKHVMYFFIITFEDPLGCNRILCKIGYSFDLITRFKSLEKEYKCKFYLINVKTVQSEKDEKEFHSLLKTQFPELCVKLTLGSHEKDEIYVFDAMLYQTFANYKNKIKLNDDVTGDEESENILKRYFDNIEERFEHELVMKLKNIIKIENIVNEFQKETAISINKHYYDYLLIKENTKILFETNRHEEAIMDKKIREKIREKEIELEILKINTNKKN